MKLANTAALSALLLCSRPSPALAHDFWIQPREYWIAPHATTALLLQVGHGSSRQRSAIPKRRIAQFEAVTPSGKAIDLRAQLQPGEASEDGAFQLDEPGSHVLFLQTDDHAESHLPAARFNDYLRDEGLTPAMEQRAKMNRTDMDGSERYSRCVKAIVQVGPPGADTQDQVSKPVGLLLEIVPEANPYRVPQSASLPIRVLYAGRPLSGALIKLTNLDDDAAPFEVQRSDHEGRATFAMPASGTWLMNVVWTKALRGTDETDFKTTFSSLTFGFPTHLP